MKKIMLVFLLIFLTGCGQSGRLYLTEQETSHNETSTSH